MRMTCGVYTACIDCPAGKASSAEGASELSSCEECPKNTFSYAAQATCTACPPGSAAPAGSTGEDACAFSMAMRLEISRLDYLLAADRFKKATAPYKTARDAMTTAISSYTESMYEAGGGRPSSSNGGSKVVKPSQHAERGRGGLSQGRGRVGHLGSQTNVLQKEAAKRTEENEKLSAKIEEAARKRQIARFETKEGNKIVEEASKVVDEKEAQVKALKEAAEKKRMEAQKWYAERQRIDDLLKKKAAKRLHEEEEVENKKQKARLSKELLWKARQKDSSNQEMDAQLSRGRSQMPWGMHVKCGGDKGDGSLDEECGEEPTGENPRKNSQVMDGAEFYGANLLGKAQGL